MVLKPGVRLVSSACETEVVVIRAPGGEVDLQCGGAPMVPMGREVAPVELDGSKADGSLLGKRYVSTDGSLEVLCTRGGRGSLFAADAQLAMKESKKLPSSD
jgi:hypothetical protein